MIIGLAPGAHGANRTGRMFTGDRSGDFLYAQLYRAGFANQPTSRTRGRRTGAARRLHLRRGSLRAARQQAAARGTPQLRGYLEEELDLLQPRAVLALGAIAFDAYLRLLVRRGHLLRARLTPSRMAPNASCRRALPRLFASYHPSQQNTQTGRLTPAMFCGVLRRIRRVLDSTKKR